MEKRNHAGLARGLWLIPLILVTLAVLAGGYAYYRHETERIRQQKYDEIAAIAKLKAGQIQQWRQERLKDLWRSSGGRFFVKGLQEFMRDRNNTVLQKELQHRLAMEQESKGYADVIILEVDGRILLSARDQSEIVSPVAKRVVEEALANRTAELSDFYRGPQGTVQLDGAVPFLDLAGQPIAVLVMRSNAESSLYPLIQSWPTPGRTAETLLVRKDGEDVLFLNDLRHHPDSAMSLRSPLTRTDMPAVQAVLGKQGMFQGRDYRGVEVLADLRPIPNSPWFMVAKVDTSEILTEAHYRAAVIAIFSALFILLAAGMTAYGYRHRQARLYQDLYQSERDQREAQEQFRTILYSIGDAVITTDTGSLVKQMNPVAEALTGWSESEAVGRPLEEIFRIINEQTRQPCQNPVEKVLTQGQVVGLANHTLLIGRDGTERVLADSGAPIRDEHGNILGVVLVFRDVTERARVSEELRLREETLRAILASSPVGIVLTRDRCIKWANDSWVQMFGFSNEDEYLDQPTSLMHPSQEDYEHARKMLYDNIKLGKISEAEASLKRKDGTLFDARIRINLLDASDPSKGTISAISDTSERKMAEEALRESESFLNSVIDQSPYPMFISDHQGTLIRTNKALLDLLHISDEEVVGKYNVLRDNIVKDQGFLPLVTSVFERGDTVRFEITYDSSELKHIQVRQPVFVILDVTMFPIKDSSGNITNAVIQHIDITHRKQAEDLLRESEERLRLAWETIPDAVGITRLEDGAYVDVNKGFTVLSGYDREEVLGKSALDLSIWHDPGTRQRYVSCLLADGHVKDFEAKMRRKDGKLRTVLMSATQMTLKGEPHILSVGKEVEELYRAVEALRVSEEKYRSIFDNAVEGIFQTTPDGRLIGVNPAAARMFGFTSPEEAIREVTDLSRQLYARPEDREDFKRRFDDRGRVEGFEVERRRRDGTLFWASINARAVRDESGNVLYYEGTIEDITTRKKAEEALRESEERYRDLVENIEDLICTHDLCGDLLFVNQAPAKILGYSPDDLIGTNLRDYLLPSVRDQFDAYLAAIKNDGHASGLMLIQTKNGEKRVWEYRNRLRTEGPGAPIVQGLARDITERKRTEEALHESEQEYQRLFGDAIDGICMIKTDGTLVEANQAFLDISGYRREELIGRSVLAIYVDPQDWTRFRQVIDPQGFVKEYPTRFQRKDGTEIDGHVTFRVRLNKEGRIVGYRGMIRDVTEQKKLERELIQAQKMEAVGTLAGGIAHDFNNLLTVVMGFSELLLGEKEQDDREYADLQKIFHAAKNGAELVQRLLMFSRKAEPKPVPINLNKQIVQVEKLLRRTIPRMIDIHLDLSPDLPEINADPSQVEQVLMNLAVNARDAMPDTGRLTVTTQAVTLDEEYCRLHIEANPGEYVLLEISDTGQGMDKKTVEHIFEPFFTTKEMGRGTGLGLAMVYGIVSQHNGHIAVYSEVGKGTTFRVYLPAIPAGVETEVQAPEIMPARGTETVLLVDDEELVRELGARILTKHGYTVLRAENGRDALDLFKRKSSHISLVILDLIMPEMGGMECLKELLKIDPKVKVLVASGYSGDTSIRESIEMGAKGFVSKPFRVNELLRDVRAVLDEG